MTLHDYMILLLLLYMCMWHIVDKSDYITVESRDYAPSLCMLALGKSGEGAYLRDPYISA